MPAAIPPQNYPVAAQAEQQRIAAEILQTQIKIVTASYSSGAAYTNLILLGGYAGFFGLWQLTGEYLTRNQALWSALLVLISLVFFIFFEVTKMIFTTRSVTSKAKVLQKPEVRSNPSLALAALMEVEAELQRAVAPLMRFWAVTVFICVGTALGAIGILATAFVSGLLS